jgi:hypothetical protein
MGRRAGIDVKDLHDIENRRFFVLRPTKSFTQMMAIMTENC